MPTVQEVFQGNRHLFAPVPLFTPHVSCRYCLGPVGGPFPQCFDCYEIFIQDDAPDILSDAVVPMTIAVSPSPWYYRLYTYKRGRGEYASTLAALAWTYMEGNMGSVRQFLGGEPDIITVVPSKRGPTFDDQPFVRTLRMVPPLRDQLVHVLDHRPEIEYRRRTYNPDLFNVVGDVRDRRIVLLEDTWITGATPLSAGGALVRAGAAAVIILPLARAVHNDFLAEEHPYREMLDLEYDVFRWPRTIRDITH